MDEGELYRLTSQNEGKVREKASKRKERARKGEEEKEEEESRETVITPQASNGWV